MNLQLREEIVKHVFANLGIISSEFVRSNTKSILDKEFLLNEKLLFENQEEQEISNKIWGCQLSAESQELKILIGNCSQYDNIPEFAVIVQLKDAPAYGLYLVCNSKVNSESLIGCTLNSKDWMECGTYLQATFLSGMEQIRDIGLSWHKCTNYSSQIELLKSFIKFHDNINSEI